MDPQEILLNQTPILQEFLENILKRKIISFKVSEGSHLGDNFTCIVISLEILTADATEPLHLVIKTFPSHPTRQKLLKDTNMFFKEYQMYHVWLPELIRFQKSMNGNDHTLQPAMPEYVAGAAIDYTTDPKHWKDLDPMLNNFILLMDVRKTYGFKMADKLKSLERHQVKAVMGKLAQYHALGHAYKIRNNLTSVRDKFPFMVDPFNDNPNQKPAQEAMLKGHLQLISDMCKDFLEERPEISESLSKLMDPKLGAEYLAMFLNPNGMNEEQVEDLMSDRSQKYTGKPLKDQWIVPGHGDCWTNNLLFKTDDNGNVTGVTLVDLQIARESCIMADLVYFLFISTDTNFRNTYLDEILNCYHARFVHFCEILKVDPFPSFTLENFQRKFHRSKLFGFLYACMVLPFFLKRPEPAVNMDNVEGLEGENIKDTNRKDVYVEIFQNVGRDEKDESLLRDRFTSLMSELYEQGVL